MHIFVCLYGHKHFNEVQTMIQVFIQNTKYKLVENVSDDGITVLSKHDSGFFSASVYEGGLLLCEEKIQAQCASVKEFKNNIKIVIFKAFTSIYKYLPQWGILTGIRPVKIVNELIENGYGDSHIKEILEKQYLINSKKIELMIDISKNQQLILNNINRKNACLYIGIPFCPTKCLYCSFTSFNVDKYEDKIDEYINCINKELEAIKGICFQNGINIDTVYIGGGTPSSINEDSIKKLLYSVNNCFSIDNNVEFTFEAGRPDTITTNKLKIMKSFGVNRISINPQTMNDRTLELIGRNHNSNNIEEAFHYAREQQFTNINMDIIVGLPDESISHIQKTFERLERLSPDSITVHTLAVKRASALKEKLISGLISVDGNSLDSMQNSNIKNIDNMLEFSYERAASMNMEPYYLYRQKNMAGNLENVGFAKRGKESVYNIAIMEEIQSIFAIGAGAITKIVSENGKIYRVFNVKNVDEYMSRIDEMVQRKEVIEI